MTALPGFHGNAPIQRALLDLIERDNIPQTLMFSGPAGLGKATLARRVAQRLLPDPQRIEADDLSLPANQDTISEREKLTAEKRNDDPLVFASHPDFLTFPPEGPLRQISIHQMRLLRERAQFHPVKGSRRVFLIDQLDRANENAANSLLKTLEEPPPYLLLIVTATNAYDLLPTIRSRSVQFHFLPLSDDEMRDFAIDRGLDHPERRIKLGNGCPGIAASLDLEDYDRRRGQMLALLQTAGRQASFGDWVAHVEKIAASRSESLEPTLQVLFGLLEDVLLLQNGLPVLRNREIQSELEALARTVPFRWIHAAVQETDQIVGGLRRSVQKAIALDAAVLKLRQIQ